MKITFDVLKTPAFTGKREDRNNVKQLKEKKAYALTENNQRNIRESIDRLGEDSSDKNIKFLMSVNKNLQYASKVGVDKKSNNDWEGRLKSATEKALSNNNSPKKASLEAEYKRIFLDKKIASKEEKEVLGLRAKLLNNKKIQKAMMTSNNENVKNIAKNLDYFTVSSEVPTSEKKAVLQKLNHFMSPMYKITPQLKDKKPQALGEMLNDIAVSNAEDSVPNTKQINQRMHGMCADISLSRKLMSYEDKSGYVQNIMNELEDTDKMDIYDITKLGTGSKIKVDKTKIDYDYADTLGYRIVDASALHWMQIAGTSGNGQKNNIQFSTFDKENFDTFHDAAYWKDLDDKELVPVHNQLRATAKAKEKIQEVLNGKIAAAVGSKEQRETKNRDIEVLGKINGAVVKKLKKVAPERSDEELQAFATNLLKLSDNENKNSKFYIHPSNDEFSKKSQIKAYVASVLPEGDKSKLDENAAKLTDLFTLNRQTKRHMDRKFYPSSLAEKSRANKELYYAAGAYRTAKAFELRVPENLGAKLVEMNIPDKETRLSENLERLAQRVGNPNEKALVKGLSNVFMTKSAKVMTERILATKDQLDEIKTTSFDNIYNKMLMGDRKTVIKNIVDGSKNAIEAGDEDELVVTAIQMGMENVEKDEVLAELAKFQEDLSNNPTEERLTEITNKMGVKNQSDLLVGNFGVFQEQMKNPQFVMAFIKQNNIKPTQEEFQNAYNGLIKEINDSVGYIDSVEKMTKVQDSEGNILNSSFGEDVVMKEYEKRGDVVSAKMLRNLQNKFANQNKSRDIIENAKINGEKVKDSEFYSFTDAELDTFKKIDKNLTHMHREVVRSEKNLQIMLDKPLSDLARQIGREQGLFWVPPEGQSGMFDPQAVRIAEQLTDRPYYSEEDVKKVAEKIKEGPYSGVSMTSVYHNQRAGHAQYIADVAPLEVTDPITGKKAIKEAIMQDNTWGRAEHGNMWKDSLGLTRTDYSCGRGGKNGYITNDKWQNGTLIEEFTDIPGKIETSDISSKLYRKLNPKVDGTKFRLFTSGVIPGKNDKSHSAAAELVQTVFDGYAMKLAFAVTAMKIARQMSPEALEANFKRLESVGSFAAKRNEDMLKLINGVAPIDKGLATEEDYNKLPANSPLKLYMKQISLYDSYDNKEIREKINKAKSVDELRNVSADLKEAAKNDMRYMFGKTPDVLRYAKGSKNDLVKVLDKVEEKYGFSIKNKDDEMKKIFKFDAKKDEFDGSLSKTIETLNDKIMKTVAKNIDDDTVLPFIKEDLEEAFTKILRDNMEFQLSDMDSKSKKFQNAKKWIDKTFEPASDAEFVSIFRDLQEMPAEKFDKYVNRMSDEDLGIYKKPEYEYVKEIRNVDAASMKKLSGQILMQEVYDTMNFTETETLYDHQKFEKKPTYGIYKSETRTFDEVYRSLSIEMQNLEIEKYEKAQKHQALEKYGARPAFPNIKLVDDKKIVESVNTITDTMQSQIQTIAVLGSVFDLYNTVDTISAFKKGHMVEMNSEDANELKSYVQNIADITEGDESLADVNNAAKEILKKETINNLAEVTPQLSVIEEDVNSLKKDIPAEGIMPRVAQIKAALTNTQKLFIVANIVPQKRREVAEALQAWTLATIKNDPQKDEIRKDLAEKVADSHLMKSPSILLKEFLRCANKVQDDKNPVLNALYNYVQGAASKSVLSDVEFELMQATENGYVDGIKNRFQNLKVPKTQKNNAGKSIASREGLDAMITNLRMHSDNINDTVWLFLNQTGLNDEAMDIEYDKTDFAELKNGIIDMFSIAAGGKKIMGSINNILPEFFAKVEKNEIPEDKIADVMIATIKKDAKQNGVENFEFLKAISKPMKDSLSATIEKNPTAPIADVTKAVAQAVINSQSQAFFGQINDTLQGTMNDLINNAAFIDGLQLVEGSEAFKKREDYSAKLDDLLAFAERLNGNKASQQA